MDLTIAVLENRLTIDGRSVVGHRRWEAAAIGTLIEGQHRDATSGCGEAVLQAALQALGQPKPLNRKQLSRLWTGAAAMFEVAGAAEAFNRRFGYPSRGRTVGPWWWTRLPADQLKLERPERARAPGIELPQLVKPETALASFAHLCQHILMCRALLLDGRFEEAETGLRDNAAWQHASAESLAFRQLCLVEVHLQRRDFDGARRTLDAAAHMLGKSVMADVHLRGTLRYLNNWLLYVRAPMHNHVRILASLAPVLERAPSAVYLEVDRHARGMSLNLAALCERRLLEQHARRKRTVAARSHLDAALRYWSAALYGFITANQYQNTQNACSNVAYLLQRAHELGVLASPDGALEWYAMVQILHNRFGLADNSVWEYIFLGDFWLYVPSVRPAFESMAARVKWAGCRPDHIDFYKSGFKRAKELGEPRQRAHTALNLWHFACGQHDSVLAEDAKRELLSVIGAHPDLGDLLLSEGYSLPNTLATTISPSARHDGHSATAA